jgi:hypothetical protein
MQFCTYQHLSLNLSFGGILQQNHANWLHLDLFHVHAGSSLKAYALISLHLSH